MTPAPHPALYDQGDDSADQWHQLKALVGSLRRRIANQEAEIAAQEATIAMLRRKVRRAAWRHKIAAAISSHGGSGSDGPGRSTSPRSIPGPSRGRGRR